jgi:hypothetical protein
MWWQFKSAFVRKIAFLLAAAFFGLLVSHHARAQTSGCFKWEAEFGLGNFQTVGAACSAINALDNSQRGDGSVEATTRAVDGNNAPLSLGAVAGASSGGFGCFGTFTDSKGNSLPAGFGGGISVSVGSCPASCANLPTVDAIAAITSSSFNGGGLICVDGCGYTSGGNSLAVGRPSPGASALMGKAVPTGQGCGSGDGSVAASSKANCMSDRGINMCVDDRTGVAVVNSDLVNPASAPNAGLCTSYSDGAVACSTGSQGTFNIVAGPSAAGGGKATPDVVVAAPGDVIDYFSPATVAASPTAVGTVNGGSPIGSPSGAQGGSNPCTPSALGVTPIVTCSGTSVSTPGLGSGSGTGAGGTCPPGQSCAGVTDANAGGQDCVTPPSCTDTDVNMCAIITQSWLSRCASTSASDVASAVQLQGGEAVASVISDQSAVLTESGPISGGSGTCPAPIVFVWQGQSISFDIFKYLCMFAVQISFAVMASAFVAGAKIWLGALLA